MLERLEKYYNLLNISKRQAQLTLQYVQFRSSSPKASINCKKMMRTLTNSAD